MSRKLTKGKSEYIRLQYLERGTYGNGTFINSVYVLDFLQ